MIYGGFPEHYGIFQVL